MSSLVALLVGMPATPAFATTLNSAVTSTTSSDVLVATFAANLDCSDIGDWSAAQFTYDVDGNSGGDTAATGLGDCSGTTMSITFPAFTVAETSSADQLRYTQSGTASQRVTVSGGSDVATGNVSITDDTGPRVFAVSLSYDSDGNQIWDAVNDVLTITWSETATLATGVLDNDGYEAAEDANLEALLGTQVTFGSGSVAKVLGSGSSSWTLTMKTAAMTEGVALNDTANGTANGDVTDGSMNTQVASPGATVQGGAWPRCNTTVGDTTVTTRCITAFSTASDGDLTATSRDNDDLDLSVFDTGLLQIQVVNADATNGQSPGADQYELVGANHLLAADEQVTIGLNIGTLDPTVLIGTGGLSSYTVTTGASNTVQIVGSPQAASFTWAISCSVGSCGNDSTAATIDYAGTLTYALDALSSAAPADRAAMDGSWIMTDAQSFGAPTWNASTGTFDIAVAAPHFLSNGSTVNIGFFRAFIPVAMFGANYFNVDPNNAVYTATADGDGATVSSTIVTSGSTVIGVQLDVTGFHYSSPTIKVKAATAPASSTPGTGGGTTTTTPPAPAPPAFDEPVEDTVEPGEEVTTDPTGEGATEQRPTQAAIVSPVAGTVRIEQKTTTTTTLPSGQTALDVQIDIDAPPATVDEPLVLKFEIDASVLEGVDLDRLVVYRNGQPVPACVSASRALPDPCLATTGTQADGDLSLTVRTSRASSWNFGVVEGACPDGLVPAADFTDVPTGAAHSTTIDCAAWWGAVEGRGRAFSPKALLTRGQAASIIRRIIDDSKAGLPAPGNRFDDEGADHGDSIERLAAAGILNGVGDRTFAPEATITRAQMAKLLVEAYEYASRETLPEGPDAFTDDDVALEAWIDRAARAGLVQGRTATTFAPHDPVTRAQVGSFAVYLLEALVAGDHADPPLR